MVKPNLTNYLRKEIVATGFPLEIEISSLLDKNWIVYNNDPFVDEDEGKTRELDIYAIHKSSLFPYSYLKRRGVLLVTANLLVECKKTTTHAWVFFTRPNHSDDKDEWGPPNGNTVDFLEAFSHRNQSFLDRVDFPKMHYNQFPRVAYNYYEVKLQKENKESIARREQKSGEKSIFEAQNQLWKYLTYNAKELCESWEKDRSWKNIFINFPSIVLDGDLFEATGPSERVRLQKRNHIILSFSRRSKTLGEEQTFMVDVVTKQYFRQYISLIAKEVALIRKEIKANSDYYSYEADSLIENLP